MKDTSRIKYEVIAINDKTGETQSLGIGRDFQAMLHRDGVSAKQRAEGWRIEIKERRDLGLIPTSSTRPPRRRRSRQRRLTRRVSKRS